MKIIILAGGSGDRLFPLSRDSYPKQFLKIFGDKSLLVQTVLRFRDIVSFSDIIIVTNEKYIFNVKAEMRSINASEVHIIPEPQRKNTAPAIGLAIVYCKEILGCKDDEVLFVSPADHLIKPERELGELILKNVANAQNDYIVTLGIFPTKPETGYGYIEVGKGKIGNAYKVISFKEKPDIDTAKAYLTAGNYYWNSGMFMFSIKTMKEEMKKYVPEVLNILQNGYAYTINNFTKMPNISIDYAVAEKSSKLVLATMANVYWSDIGSFDTIASIMEEDKGTVLQSNVHMENCNNTIILGRDRLIAGIDLQDLIVVDTPDVLLIVKKGESQKVKNIVDKLKKQQRKEIQENLTIYRPWGRYTILSVGDGYKVKKIVINPGEKLSLQVHNFRSEHWTVITGTGKLTVGNKKIIFKENESTFIPIGEKHRLENPGTTPLVIIEIQNGKYLGEDDIVRFDDEYGRLKQ